MINCVEGRSIQEHLTPLWLIKPFDEIDHRALHSTATHPKPLGPQHDQVDSTSPILETLETTMSSCYASQRLPSSF
jgi:hypothetical protein